MLLRRCTPFASGGALGEMGTRGGFECLLLPDEDECLVVDECLATAAGSWSGLAGESGGAAAREVEEEEAWRLWRRAEEEEDV